MRQFLSVKTAVYSLEHCLLILRWSPGRKCIVWCFSLCRTMCTGAEEFTSLQTLLSAKYKVVNRLWRPMPDLSCLIPRQLTDRS